MKKVVLKLDLHDDKEKQMAIETVACLQGIDSISMDMKEKKLTVIGDVDPVCVVCKLRTKKKQWRYTEIVTVGPAKEEKKDDGKKDGDKKEDEKIKTCYPYYPPYYHVMRVDESPTSCTMC